MNFPRNFAFLCALALASMLTSAGCKSDNQQASNAQPGAVNGQSSQTAQPATGSSASSSAPAPPPASAPGSAPASAPAPQTPPPPTIVELPSGTRLHVRLDQDLGSKISQPGDSFTATVADAVMVNGQTVIHRGARADGTVIDAKAWVASKAVRFLKSASTACTPIGAAIRSRAAPSTRWKKAKANGQR